MFGEEEMRACVLTVLTWTAATRGAVYSLYNATTSALRRQCRQMSAGLRRGVGNFVARRGGSRTSNVPGDNDADADAAANSGGRDDELDEDDDGLQGFGLDRWEAAEAYDPLSPRRFPALGLASRESRHSTDVVFRNRLGERARIFWIDYQGKTIRYKTLEPNQAHSQQTFATHPWTFTTVSNDDDVPHRRLVVDGMPVFIPPVSTVAGTAAVEDNHNNNHNNHNNNLGEEDHGEERVFNIEEPPIRRWTHDTHGHFPEFFKQVCRVFLLAHARLRRDAEEETSMDDCCGDDDDDDNDDDATAAAALSEEADIRQPDVAAAAAATAAAPDTAARLTTTLGNLPPEVVAYVLKLAAPALPMYVMPPRDQRSDESATRVEAEAGVATVAEGAGPVVG